MDKPMSSYPYDENEATEASLAAPDQKEIETKTEEELLLIIAGALASGSLEELFSIDDDFQF